MNIDLQDYDFPVSHGMYRALCSMHGEPVPQNIDIDPWAKTEDEHKQAFIEWQDIERAKYFGSYSSEKKPAEKPREYYKPLRTVNNRVTPPPPYSPPAPTKTGGIIERLSAIYKSQ